MDNPAVREQFLHQYNAITAENQQKPSSILPEQPNFNTSTWNWGPSDAAVNFANENNIYMVGHTLVWHEQSYPWLSTAANGNPLTRAQAISNMETYINAVVGRYKGRIDAWDVTNEVINDWFNINTWNANPDWRHHARNNVPWYLAFANGASAGECGTDYIYYAFRFARLADPSALLIYNDFNEDEPGKREAIAQMIEQLNQRWQNDPLYDGRLLIEAIGMQSHYQINYTSLDNVRASLRRFIQTGVRIHVSELDVKYGSIDFNDPNYAVVNRLTPAQLQQQADMYKNLFAIYMEFSDYIDRVSIWGMSDDWSWLASAAPTLYTLDANGNFVPKHAFWGILELVGIRPY
jgi:GH35 family endo-1,4-beta-xylanase